MSASTSQTSLAANIRKTSEAFIQTWTTPKWIDATEPNLALRAPNCVHITHPASVNLPPRNNTDWEVFYRDIAPLVFDSKMVINDYFGVPEERRSVSRSTVAANTSAGPYNNEYVWFLWFTEDGKHIERIEEFIGSAAVEDLLKRFKEGGHWPRS